MSDPSKKKEVCTSIEEEDDNRMFLTGKNSFFDVVLTNSNIKPHYNMFVPVSIVSLLPSVTVPTVLRYGGKEWNVSYKGESVRPIFRPGWNQFVNENHLKPGDSCVFELMENTATKLRFEVIILRNEELPPELQAIGDSSVIEID